MHPADFIGGKRPYRHRADTLNGTSGRVADHPGPIERTTSHQSDVGRWRFREITRSELVDICSQARTCAAYNFPHERFASGAYEMPGSVWWKPAYIAGRRHRWAGRLGLQQTAWTGEARRRRYYASSCAAGRITRLLLADVSGHGKSVAAIAADLRLLMRRFINRWDQASSCVC